MTRAAGFDPALTVNAVQRAMATLVERDRALLELNAHELSVVHRFGVYLEHELRSELAEHQLTIDLDYDRHGYTQKWLPERPDRHGPARFRPDLIVHRRLTDEANCLVVEWKKSATPRMLELLDHRIRLLMSADPADGGYTYDVGVIADSRNDGVRWSTYGAGGAVEGWQELRSEPNPSSVDGDP